MREACMPVNLLYLFFKFVPSDMLQWRKSKKVVKLLYVFMILILKSRLLKISEGMNLLLGN